MTNGIILTKVSGEFNFKLSRAPNDELVSCVVLLKHETMQLHFQLEFQQASLYVITVI